MVSNLNFFFWHKCKLNKITILSFVFCLCIISVNSNFTVYYCIYIIWREAPWASLAADTGALQIAIITIWPAMQFIPLWEWTWCHRLSYVIQDWNACCCRWKILARLQTGWVERLRDCKDALPWLPYDVILNVGWSQHFLVYSYCSRKPWN